MCHIIRASLYRLRDGASGMNFIVISVRLSVAVVVGVVILIVMLLFCCALLIILLITFVFIVFLLLPLFTWSPV